MNLTLQDKLIKDDNLIWKLWLGAFELIIVIWTGGERNTRFMQLGCNYLRQQTMYSKGISVGQLILFYGYALF